MPRLFQGPAGDVYAWYIEHPAARPMIGQALWGTTFRSLLAALDAQLARAEGAQILDVPCGSGLAFRRPAAARADHIYGLDISTDMVARARQTATAHGVAATVLEGDAERLPDAWTGRFDTVLSINSLHCFARPERVVDELARCLRPNGTLLLTSFVCGARRRTDLFLRSLAGEHGFGPPLSEPQLLTLLETSGLAVRGIRRDGALRIVTCARSPA